MGGVVISGGEVILSSGDVLNGGVISGWWRHFGGKVILGGGDILGGEGILDVRVILGDEDE